MVTPLRLQGLSLATTKASSGLTVDPELRKPNTTVSNGISTFSVVAITSPSINSNQNQNSSKPWLGISGIDITSDIANVYGLNGTTSGALVVDIQPGSPAEKAGLIAGNKLIDINGTKVKLGGGDIILKVDNTNITKSDDLITYLDQKKVGDRLNITILRNGHHIIPVYVTLAARPAFLTYETPAYGIKMQYPFSWFKSDRDLAHYNQIVNFHPSPLVSENASNVNVTIALTDFSQNITLRDLDHIVSLPISRSPILYNIIESSSSTLGGNAVHNMVYTYKKGQLQYETMKVWTAIGNRAYSVEYDADQPNYMKYLSYVRDMIGSFIIQAIPSPGNVSRISPFLTYENSAFGVKIQYPNDWRISTEGLERSVVQFVAPNLVSDLSLKLVRLDVDKLPVLLSQVTLNSTNSNTILNEVAREFAIGDLNTYPDFYLVESNTTSIPAANAAHKMVFTFRDPRIGPTTIKIMAVFTIKNNKVYSITYEAPEVSYPNYLPIVQKMIDSFEIMNTNATTRISHNANQTQNLLTYENSIYGIKFQYPSYWQKVNSTGEIVELRNGNPSPLPFNTFAIAVENGFLQNTSLAALASNITNNILPDFKLIKLVPTTIAGNPAEKIIGIFSLERTSNTLMVILTIKDDKLYVINYSTLSSLFSYTMPSVQKVLDSFKFLSPEKILSAATPN